MLDFIIQWPRRMRDQGRALRPEHLCTTDANSERDPASYSGQTSRPFGRNSQAGEKVSAPG